MPFREILKVVRGEYKQSYDGSQLDSAYTAVKNEGMSVHGAAKRYGVPVTTLRDRIDGRVHIDCCTTGAPPLFSLDQESALFDHIKTMSDIGYGYTRSEVVNLASDYAFDLGLRDRDRDLSFKWYYGFMDRWPEMSCLTPAGLSELRARAASPDCIARYFVELDRILTKYDLKDKPHLIYNIDEKGIQTGGGKPPKVVTAQRRPQVVTSERSQNVTVLGCGNAAGSLIPPFFVFPGKRMIPELLEGGTAGCDGTVSDTGYSNGSIFIDYIQNHLYKYLPGRDPNQPVLVLYDGHRSHVSISLIEWARQHNIILFVLPPHTSHILQPMDVACFGPFETVYQTEKHKFTRKNKGRSVTRYDVCSLACNCYEKALRPENLRSAFSKTGIYPLNPEAVNTESILPSIVFQGQKENDCQNVENEAEGNCHNIGNEADGNCQNVENEVEGEENSRKNKEFDQKRTSDFFHKRGGAVLQSFLSVKKSRRNISSVIAGKAITEQDTFEKVKEYNEMSNNKKKSVKTKTNKACKSTEENKKNKKETTKTRKTKSAMTTRCDSSSQQPGTSGVGNSQQPGPSGVGKTQISSDSYVSDEEIPEEDKCCICKKFEPESLRNKPYIQLVNWAMCSRCMHWVHLSYCVPQRVVRRNSEIVCPHCN